ncbi:hypothetical protein EON65_51080 [archaeon]|nr:MAG: hypothetical protein EON65_51080 [archaeon]
MSPRDTLLRLFSSPQTQKRETNLRSLQQKVEEATRWGPPHPHPPSPDLPYRRNAYYEDMQVCIIDFL